MHFVYIDDSGDGTVACFSALIVPADQWRSSLDHLMSVRKLMTASDGVFVAKELHSTDWLAGKGRVGTRVLLKPDRVRLYDAFLAGIAMLPSAQLINACVPKADQNRAFEWLLNRIQTNMRKAGSQCVIFCDEGKNYDSIKRKIGVHNYINSKFGGWGDGGLAKNIRADRILEDIIYRQSERSIFIQAADACAYALLRREQQLPSKNALGLHNSFYILERIMVKTAFGQDDYGIIR